MQPILQTVSVLILAGGKSSRMGRDKAWLELDGEPLAQRLAARVLPIASEIIFSTHSPDRYRQLALTLSVPVRVVTDDFADGGPLAGIHAGLRAASHELVLALAVDMPFVKIALLRYMARLASGYDAVVPVLPPSSKEEETCERQNVSDLHIQETRLEPLHAFYSRGCLPAITAHLEAGERRVVSFLPDVRTRVVMPDEIAPYDPDFSSFRNLNTPEDWRLASKQLTADDGTGV